MSNQLHHVTNDERGLKKSWLRRGETVKAIFSWPHFLSLLKHKKNFIDRGYGDRGGGYTDEVFVKKFLRTKIPSSILLLRGMLDCWYCKSKVYRVEGGLFIATSMS